MEDKKEWVKKKEEPDDTSHEVSLLRGDSHNFEDPLL
jgi:hypothetical protein